MPHIRIVEVGPRDGLQNEAKPIPTPTKIELIKRLVGCGHQTIEATSFVSPKWVPQLADAASVYAGIEKPSHVAFPVLVPNLQGMQRALEVGVKEVAVFTAASEAFNLKNTNASIAESLERFKPIMALAREHRVKVRGYVSTVLGCPYQGKVEIADVVRVAKSLFESGCYEISLGDTIGVGTAKNARAMLSAVASEVAMPHLAIHFHDTYGQALANIAACLELGVQVIDSAVAGLGGCPYAKGASGNVASEDVIYLLEGFGMSTGVDLRQLAKVGAWISSELGRSNQSKAGKALDARDG
jgi:hydroxymethylglutaryl-CoA lyase